MDSIYSPDFDANKNPVNPVGQSNASGPQGAPSGDFSQYMQQAGDTPSDFIALPSNQPVYPDGRPNAAYWFHFFGRDQQCKPPQGGPPGPDANLPNVRTMPPPEPGGWSVRVITVPCDPATQGPWAKYYNWVYMYATKGGTSSTNWQYCGSGPEVNPAKMPANLQFMEKNFPHEYWKLVLWPMEQQTIRSMQSFQQQSQARMKEYQSEADG